MKTFKEQKIITVKDVYGGEISIPKGYRVIAFRPPCKGEIIIGQSTLKPVLVAENFREKDPRIILCKEEHFCREYSYTVERPMRPSDVYKKESAKSLEDFCLEQSVEVIDFKEPAEGEKFIILTSEDSFGVVAYGPLIAGEVRFIVRSVRPKKKIVWS